MACKVCGSNSRAVRTVGNHTGLYCGNCYAWIKWLGKSEIKKMGINIDAVPRAEHNKKHSMVAKSESRGETTMVDGIVLCCGYDAGYEADEFNFCPRCGKEIVEKV